MIIGGVALCVQLEPARAWAARVTGPILVLIGAMILSNARIMPSDAPIYDVVDGYLVPAAIPLLLFRANLRRIWNSSGMSMC